MRLRSSSFLGSLLAVGSLVLLSVPSVFADGITGRGTFAAQGSGSATIHLHGSATLTGSGVLFVKDNGGDATVHANGHGTRTDLGNGWVRYEGTGRATVSGTNVKFIAQGDSLSVVGSGRGTASFTGSGSCSANGHTCRRRSSH